MSPALLLLVLLFVASPTRATGSRRGKICIGTNGRMSVPYNREHHYRNLRERYTNCTYVDGNLELTWLQEPNLDLSFLRHIREVTGYVLISHVDVMHVVLPELQIIRGRTLFKINVHEEQFSLIVTLSKMYTLELPMLRDILSGSVGILNNYNLCHIKTIIWDEIISGQNEKLVHVYNFSSAERSCAPCHEKCEKGCWGDGEHNCQKFSKINCSPQCYKGRCFDTQPRDCCHLLCAGGCTGPKQSDCLACKNFNNDGMCTEECPPMQKYNPITYSWENNPNGKYAYGATCVKKCPDHLLKDNGTCVRSCPPQKMPVNGECVFCPKKCKGDTSVHSGNIHQFENCTIIEGSVTILDGTFTGFQQIFGARYGRMHPDKLEVFSTLKEITGHLNIQGSHEDFTNLSYFRNLETIGGRQLTEYFSALFIVKSTLKSLDLKSLKQVSSGSIAILENKDLCYVNGINWLKIKKSADHHVQVQNNKDEARCKEEGRVCDDQCSSEGCWGPGPRQCLSCANFQLNDLCLQNCSVLPLIYLAAPKVCKQCHEECESTCVGPGPDSCKNVRDGPFCPTSKYLHGGECLPCHANCVDGCSGPGNVVGPGGCHSCEKAILNANGTFGYCLRKNESCPEGFFYEWVSPQELAGKAICRRCHPRCKRCTGYGFHEQVCQECQEYKRGEQCPEHHYADEERHVCELCHRECLGCVGPTAADCLTCRNYRIYLDEDGDMTKFNCTENCPPDRSNKIYTDSTERYCSSKQDSPSSAKSAAVSWSTFLAASVGVVVVIGGDGVHLAPEDQGQGEHGQDDDGDDGPGGRASQADQRQAQPGQAEDRQGGGDEAGGHPGLRGLRDRVQGRVGPRGRDQQDPGGDKGPPRGHGRGLHHGLRGASAPCIEGPNSEV